MKQRFLALCLSLVSVVIMAAQGKATSENIDDPEGTNHALKVTTSEPKENIWDWQIHYKLDAPLTKGKTYVLTMRAKGSGDGTFALWPIDTASENKNQWGGSDDVQYEAEYGFTPLWKTYTWNIPFERT